jgi:hypothetical protein
VSAFSEKHVAAAIARLPSMSTKEIRELRARAEGQRLGTLLEACDEQLASRPIEFSADAAKAFEAQAKDVADLDLAGAIRHAFTRAVPPTRDEVELLRWFATNPGGSYQAAVKDLGNEGLGLWIGHLVYDRYGCFRKFLKPIEDQSSVLLEKDRSGDSVRYRLRPEAEAVFREIGII